MRRLAIGMAGLLAAGTAAAQHECQREADAMLRVACYDEAIEKQPADSRAGQCRAIAGDALRGRCYDNLFGAPPSAASCATITDATRRLACYDLENAPGDKASVRPAPRRWHVIIREEGLPDSLAYAEPASVGYVRKNGASSALLKASVIATGRARTDAGWYGFAALDVNHDLSGSSRSNAKTVSAGMRGVSFDAYEKAGVAVDTTVRAGFLKDSEAHTESWQALLDNQIVVGALAVGIPWAGSGTPLQLVPRIGLAYEDIREAPAGESRGHATSAYWSGALSVWPAWISKRVKLGAKAQRFVDLNASNGLTKRYANHYKLAIDYYLYNPTAKGVTFTPIVGLSREIGDNPLTGTAGANRTALVLRFSLN